MNDNKTWRVTIQLTVVATDDPIDDNAFYDNMYGLVSDDYDMCSTVEGVILVGAEAVELKARPYTLKIEPATEPVAKAPAPKRPRVNGKRPWRTRTDTDLIEFVYLSSDYRVFSKSMGVGTASVRDKKKCVWLTKDEAAQVNVKVMERRARQAARRAAKGGE
jgi:hypothetical protein